GENAIEAAVSLVEKNGGEVIVASIGTDDSVNNMRTALAMGCERGILVKAKDDELDSDLTARIFAKLFEAEKPDLFILGKQAIDGDSNQVGQLLAEYLGLPQACFVSKVEMLEDKTTLRAVREVDGGLETVELRMPAVITADLRLNTPRYPTLPNIMKAKRKEIKEFTIEGLGLAKELKVSTLRYSAPPQRKGGIKVKTVEELVDKLKNEAKVL
ncbi:MAG: electron transfer flavoprotein subunit beta/FixA family protein, partial [Deltaproteobacteria bacterium]|nr:electron transfer flavoprotein subunit beta/FixA family protein [Deltaproteobacteria bacterium]